MDPLEDLKKEVARLGVEIAEAKKAGEDKSFIAALQKELVDLKAEFAAEKKARSKPLPSPEPLPPVEEVGVLEHWARVP